MKKISLWLLGAMALGFTACDDAPAEAPIQSNPQEPVLTTGDVIARATIAPSVALESYRDKSALEVLMVESTENLPEGAKLGFKFEIANSEDFSKERVLDVDFNDNVGTVDSQVLNEDHYALFGKKMEAKTVYYRIPVYVIVGGMEYRLGGPDYYMAEGTYEETCMDPGTNIESAYYLLSDVTGWDLTETGENKFWHPNVDVYDYPIFSIVIESPGNTYWKVMPVTGIENGSWDFQIGTEKDGDKAMSGTLTDTNPGAGCIEDPGYYRITIDMEALTYEITRFDCMPYICTPGGGNGWSQAASQWINYNDGKAKYCGALLAGGEFKFSGPTWDVNWGASGSSLVPDGPNIAGNGLYWAAVDTQGLTYTLDHVTSVGVVGGLNGWSADAPIELAPNADESVWSADVELSGEWKIIINHSWDSNYGGSIYYPVFDGSNISGFDGKHNVSVDFTGNYPLIIIK